MQSKQKESIKIRAKINVIQNMTRIEKIDKTKSCFPPKKINKITKTLARLTKIQREKAQIRSESEYITTNTASIKSIIRKHCKKLHTYKFHNLEVLDQHFKNFMLPNSTRMKYII